MSPLREARLEQGSTATAYLWVRPHRCALGALLASALFLLGACSGSTPSPNLPQPPVEAQPTPRAEAPSEPLPAAPEAPPRVSMHEILPADLGSQFLFRAQYLGPEDDGSFRLTLWLSSPERFRLQAVDPVGRSVWTLDARKDGALWLDHRERVACRYGESIELPGLSMGAFPIDALPALLLGRIPVEPKEEPKLTSGSKAEHLELRDAKNRQWTATYRDDQLLRWALWPGAVGAGKPVAQLRREDGWWVLSDRRQDLEVRWRPIVREPMHEVPAEVEVPADYATEPCREAI